MKKKSVIIIASILLLTVLHFIILSDSGLVQRYRLNKEKDKLQNEIDNLNIEISDLKTDIINLKSNDFYVEKCARDNYKLLKPGEIIIKIEDGSMKNKRSNLGDSITALNSK
ncbi:MAG TPA: septum formation initiator family protein [bacterium]|nr:septum formation initiator family protein [bacterium]HPN29421.1 septum formation initiator family protein [bacterium]